jgi:hypothetical protein
MLSPRTWARAAAGAVWLVGAAVAGCGRGAAPGPRPLAGQAPRASAPETASLGRARTASTLQDDYERLYPERVRLARYGEARFAAADRDDAAGDRSRSDRLDMVDAPSFVVVDRVGSRVRVIAPQDHVRLLLWLDADDLYRVISEEVALSPSSDAARPAPGAGGVRLHPGSPVEVGGERGAMLRVLVRDRCVTASGWVPRSAVGSLYVPLEVEGRPATGMAPAGTAIHDRPGGHVLATFTADCEVTETGPESGGQKPIRYATESIEVRGWMSTTQGTATGPASGGQSVWGYGLSGLGLWGARSRLRLAEGTCLYARRGGPAIGLVTEDMDAPESPPVDGWWQVPLETSWGDLDVWVAAEPQPDSAADARPVAPPAPTDDEGDDDELGALGGEPTRPALRRCRR